MANTYKSIGNTAAAVVSLLAVGTLCWWQRPVTPINAPRPQDEAEIMTACLERHYAMGRTGEKFTITRAEYVSTVADSNAPGGFRYVTNSPASVQTNTIGFFPNATFNYPDSIRRAIEPGGRPYSFYPYAANTGYGIYQYELSANAYSNMGEHWTLPTNKTTYLDIDANWWTNLVTLSTRTTLTTTYTNVATTNIINVVSGYTAESSQINGANYYVGIYGSIWSQWLIGSVFQHNDEYPWYPIPTFVIVDTGPWLDDILVSLDTINNKWTATSLSASWYWESITTNLPAILYDESGWGGDITIDYVARTNYQSSAAQIITTNTTQTNTWTQKAFAFERDNKPYTWSTNAYNDMARALSLMQWQRRNVYTEAVLMYVEGYSVGATLVATERQNVFGGYFTPDTHDPISSFAWGGYWQAWRIHLFNVAQRYVFVNDSPFVLTDGLFETSGDTNNSYTRSVSSDLTPGCRSLPAGEGNTNLFFSASPWTLQPGQSVTTEWFTASGWTGTNITDIVAGMKVSATNWLRYCIDRGDTPDEYGAVYDMWSNSTDNASIPQFSVSKLKASVTYHVQFSALTNYLDHAPAR